MNKPANLKHLTAAGAFNAGTMAAMQEALRAAESRAAVVERRSEKFRSLVAVAVSAYIRTQDSDALAARVLVKNLSDALMSTDPTVTQGH